MTYRIRNWSQHFENNRTRELKELRFVILPNKHDGDGYTELLDHENGASHYGAWVAIVQVASKCDPRGTLLRDGAKAHDPASLSRLTRLPKVVFEEAIPRLVSIGWMEQVPDSVNEEILARPIDSTIPQEPAAPIAAESRTPLRKSDTELNRTEEKRIEEKKEKELTLVAQARQVFSFWKDHLNHSKSIFDNKRERVIAARLKDGFTVEQLEAAVRGCALSSFHMGQNERGMKYDDISLICESAKNVEKFIEIAEDPDAIISRISQSNGHQTATERRGAEFAALVNVAAELRDRSEQATGEVVRRESLAS